MANEPQQKVDNVDAKITGATDATAAETAAKSFLDEIGNSPDKTIIQQTADALFKKAEGPTNPLLKPNGDFVSGDKTAGGLLPILALTRYDQLTKGDTTRRTPEALLAESGPLGTRNVLDQRLLKYLSENPGILGKIRNTDQTLSSGAISNELQTWLTNKKLAADIALKSTPAYQMARDLYGERDKPGKPGESLYDVVFRNTGRTGPEQGGKELHLFKADIDSAISKATQLGLSQTEVQRLQKISSSWSDLASAGIATDRGGRWVWGNRADYTGISRNSFAKALGIPVESNLSKPSAGQVLQDKINGDKQYTHVSGPSDGNPTVGNPVVRDYADKRRVTLNADGTRVTEFMPGFRQPDMVGGKTTEYPANFTAPDKAGTVVTERPGTKAGERIISTSYPNDYKGSRPELKGSTVTQRTENGTVTETRTDFPPDTNILSLLSSNPDLRTKYPELAVADNYAAKGVSLVERNGASMISATRGNGDKVYSIQYQGQPALSAITDSNGVVKQFTRSGETFKQDPTDPSKYKLFNGFQTTGDALPFTNMKITPDGTLSYNDQTGALKSQRLDGGTGVPTDNVFSRVTGTRAHINEKQYPADRGFIRTQLGKVDGQDQVTAVRIQDKNHKDQMVFQRGSNGNWVVTENNASQRLAAPPDIKPDGTMTYRTQNGLETTIRSDGLRTATAFDDGKGHTFKADYDPANGALKKLTVGPETYTAKPNGGFTNSAGVEFNDVRVDPKTGKIQLDQGPVVREINPAIDMTPRIMSARHIDGGQVKFNYDDKTGAMKSIDYTNGSTTDKLTYNPRSRTWSDKAGKPVGEPRIGANGAINFTRNNAEVAWGGPVLTTDAPILGKAKVEASARGPEKITYPDGRITQFGYSPETATSRSVMNSISRQVRGGGTDSLQLDQGTNQWSRLGPDGTRTPISKPELDKAGNITFKEGNMTKIWPDNGGDPRVTKMDYPGTNGWVDLKYNNSGALESAKVTGAAPARNTVELRGPNLAIDHNSGTITHTDGGVTTQIKADGTKVISRVEPNNSGRTVEFNFANVGGRSLEDARSVVVKGPGSAVETYSRNGQTWQKEGSPPTKGRLKYDNGVLNFTPDASDTALGVSPTVVDLSLTNPAGARLEPPKSVTTGTRTGGLQGSEYGSQGPWGVANNLLKENGSAQDSAAVDALRKVLQDTNQGVDFMSLAGGTQLIHDGNREAVKNAIKALIEGNGKMKGNARLTKLLSRL